MFSLVKSIHVIRFLLMREKQSQVSIELSIADFQIRSHKKPTLTVIGGIRHLKNIPGMTTPNVYNKVFSDIQVGSFSLQAWFNSLSSRVVSNLGKKGWEIYWGSESVVNGEYSCAIPDCEREIEIS